MPQLVTTNIARGPSRSFSTRLGGESEPRSCDALAAIPKLFPKADLSRPWLGQGRSTGAVKTRDSALDSLTALNVFVHAAESSSFTDAARQLGLSSSAIGKCVSRLEQRLGVRLFHRNTRSVKLTNEGNSFLQSCRKIFRELRSVEEELAQTNCTPQGRLRVSMPLAATLMVPGLGEFIRAYPDIELDLDYTDEIVDVVDGGFDMVLRSGDVGDCRLKSRRLGAYGFEIVGSPEYFARAGLPEKPEDLRDHSCLQRKHIATGKLQDWPISHSQNTDDLSLPNTATTSTLEALIFLAECGAGIACVPDFCVRRQLASGLLVSALKNYVNHTEVVRAIWPASRYTPPKLRVFIDFLTENLLQGAHSVS